MGTTLQETPSGNRLHIGIFGKTNSGKSAFINAFSGQSVSIVADVKGTTTDPVYKAMEIAPLGPCVLIDTAGFDDEGELGAMRMEKTALAAQKTELALIVFASEDMEKELEWFRYFQEKKTPVIPVVSKSDLRSDEENQEFAENIRRALLMICCPLKLRQWWRRVRPRKRMRPRKFVSALMGVRRKRVAAGQLFVSNTV